MPFTYTVITIFILIFLISCNKNEPTVESNSIKIITLAPHLAELTVEAGGLDSLVGVVSYSDFPKSLQKIQNIGDAFRVDFETIISLKPDYVLAWKNGTPRSIIDKLKQLKLNVIEIEINQLSDIPLAILEIAKLIKTESQAQLAIDDFNSELEEIKKTKYPKFEAFIQVSIKPIYTISAQHWMSEAIELCGYDNVFKELKNASNPISLESVITKNPQVIININQLEDDKWIQWQQLDAVKNNRIYTFSPDYFSRPTPRILIGIQQLCETNI